jgi:peptidoglycan/LPS O-acetylase OafA/YrhL
VAVLLVLLHHAFADAGALEPLLRPLRMAGWAGVALFFVLSGYLVTSALVAESEREGRVEVGRHLARRLARLLPPLAVLWVVTLGVRTLIHAPLPWNRVLGEVLMLQDHLGRMWLHTWSLAVEWHFCLVLPALTWLPARARLPLLAAVVVGSPLLRAVAFRPPAGEEPLPFATLLRLDALALGAAFALLAPEGIRRGRAWLAALGLVGLLPLCLRAPGTSAGSAAWKPSLAALSGAALPAACAAPAVLPAWARPLRQVGRRPCSLYLWHVPEWTWGTAALRVLTGTEPSGAGCCSATSLPRSRWVGSWRRRWSSRRSAGGRCAGPVCRRQGLPGPAPGSRWRKVHGAPWTSPSSS